MSIFGTRVCNLCNRKVGKARYLGNQYRCPQHGDLQDYEVIRIPSDRVNYAVPTPQKGKDNE